MYRVFEEWHCYGDGGMNVHEFKTSEELQKWVLANPEEAKYAWIIKGGTKVVLKVKKTKIIESYEFVKDKDAT